MNRRRGMVRNGQEEKEKERKRRGMRSEGNVL